MIVEIRPADLAADAVAIAGLDTSFDTGEVFEVRVDARDVGLEPVALEHPITKVFPIEDLADPDRPWEFTLLASADGRPCGFAAAEFRGWNRRLVLWHFYVDRPLRGQGIGRRLLDRVEAYARSRGALHIWLETSNLNVPGIGLYEHMGFTLTGCDVTLYDGTAAQGEVALFFSRPMKA